ncbi:cell division protein ZipA C-terminal FtsZ-binding domain-containing protein [Francisellaceae bacterium]|nr:cell division protein ZipA C-terminal FtsZ-binding domain-containing protein [Francisellaceae bacterium]
MDYAHNIFLIAILLILLLMLDGYRRVKRKKHQTKMKTHAILEAKIESGESEESVDVSEEAVSEEEISASNPLEEVAQSKAPEVDSNIPKVENPEAVYRESDFPSLEQGIIVLHVMAPRGYVFYGQDLAQIFYNYSFTYDERGLFQAISHQNEVLFEVVNGVEPGTFDLDNINALQTPGITVFMDVCALQNPKDEFKQMLALMYDMTDKLGASLLNEQRRRFTQSDVSRCLARIRQL